jgi:hypothetical protein
MVQGADPTPEGLKRERKGPYSPVRGRDEHPTQVPGPAVQNSRTKA